MKVLFNKFKTFNLNGRISLSFTDQKVKTTSYRGIINRTTWKYWSMSFIWMHGWSDMSLRLINSVHAEQHIKNSTKWNKKTLSFADFLKEVEITLYSILNNYTTWKTLWKGLKALLSIFRDLNGYTLGSYPQAKIWLETTLHNIINSSNRKYCTIACIWMVTCTLGFHSETWNPDSTTLHSTRQ